MIIYFVISSVVFAVSCYFVNAYLSTRLPYLQDYSVQLFDKFP
jgi:uncharacterized membrane protein YwaF